MTTTREIADGLVERRGIYIASKAKHGPRWQTYRAQGIPIISTWIDESGEGETADYHDLWHRCAKEAASAAVTIVYHEEGETLKGALLEAGAALSHGRRIIVVGDPPGTWVRHRNVSRAGTIEAAFAEAADLLSRLAAPVDVEMGEAQHQWETFKGNLAGRRACNQDADPRATFYIADIEAAVANADTMIDRLLASNAAMSVALAAEKERADTACETASNAIRLRGEERAARLKAEERHVQPRLRVVKGGFDV